MNDKKLKILEVLDCYYPSIDGPVNAITHCTKNLIENHNADVEVLVPSYPKYKDNQPFVVHRTFSIPATEGYRTPAPIFSRKARKIFKKNKYDIVHIHSPFTLGKFAAKMARKYKIPCVCTVHTKYKNDFERKLKSKFLQNFMMNYILKTMNLADRLLTVSEGAKKELVSYGYKKEIGVLRNGTDLTYPSNPEELIEMVNEKYNLAIENMIFLFVGRLVENKNIDFSLKVLKILKERNYNFKFIIVGSGPYENNLKQTIKEYNLNENVIFTGLIKDRTELSGLYLRSDMFLFPSSFDTFGLVALEAATMKTPSFMVKNTCASEVIINNENGFAEIEDENVWADKLEKCFKDKSLITNLKENSYKTIYKSWGDITKELYDIYLDTIEKYKENLTIKKNNKKE